MAQMYSILGTIQLGVIKKHSSVVGFTITTSKNKISTLSTVKIYTVFVCIFFRIYRLKPWVQILWVSKVRSSAYPMQPVQWLPKWHPTPLFSNCSNNPSMYMEKRMGESIAPCLTPLQAVNWDDILEPHLTWRFCLVYVYSSNLNTRGDTLCFRSTLKRLQ